MCVGLVHYNLELMNFGVQEVAAIYGMEQVQHSGIKCGVNCQRGLFSCGAVWKMNAGLFFGAQRDSRS